MSPEEGPGVPIRSSPLCHLIFANHFAPDTFDGCEASQSPFSKGGFSMRSIKIPLPPFSKEGRIAHGNPDLLCPTDALWDIFTEALSGILIRQLSP